MADSKNELSTGGHRRQQLPEEVATYVREQIMSGRVRSGEYLRMEPIADALGVSNTPVREGLLALCGEGFVEMVPRKGFVVSSVSEQDVRDVFWVQAKFAGELAARAAKNITRQQLLRLETIDAELGRAVQINDRQAITELGHDFHREINIAADSHRLTLLLGSAVKQLPNRFYASIEGKVAATRHDHPKLIDALRNHDDLEARALTEHHFLAGAVALSRALEDLGLWAQSAS